MTGGPGWREDLRALAVAAVWCVVAGAVVGALLGYVLYGWPW
jgi:hypothetical protein